MEHAELSSDDAVLSQSRDAETTSSGSEFQMSGATTGKVRLSTVDSL